MVTSDLGIAFFDSLVHPVLEWISTDGVHHIRYVLSWQLVELFFRFGKSSKCRTIIAFCSKLEDIVDGKPLEIGNGNIFDVITFDNAAFVGD